MNTRLPIPQLRSRFRKSRKRLYRELKAHLGNDNCAECGVGRADLREIYKVASTNAWKGDMTLDHITPMVLGGAPRDLDNLQFLCFRCHREKAELETPEIVAYARSSDG